METPSAVVAQPYTELATVTDITLLDGAFLPANSVQRKVWRLPPGEPSPSSLSLFREDDVEHSNDYLGKNVSTLHSCCQFHLCNGAFDATFDFTVPSLSGVYRIPFRMLQSNAAGVIVAVGQQRWVDFCVANDVLPGDKQAVLRQAGLAERLRHAPSISRSWSPGTESSRYGATLVIAFSSWSGSRSHSSGPPAYEFQNAFQRAGIHTALFVRDPLRAWYLRGIGASGHTFDSVVRRLESEIALIRPSKVITVGASMGAYAAVRAGLALRADVVLAFGPQVVLAPKERAALALRASPFDRMLRTLETAGEAEGFALTSLLDVVHETTWRGATEPPREPTHAQRPTPPPASEPAAASAAAPRLSRERTALGTTLVQIFAGGGCAGDVHEAALLEQAISSRAHQSATSPGVLPQAQMSCCRTLVPGSDHAVAAAMRVSGELQEVLIRYCR